ncbi:hypothetical protein D3OALGB2SA_2506 [Olavius algarvensis associated proteobacterium Delta 3]|nr:hypothetical protein D3OALGB2SA_2506 [Olavius algarvensis associated proteobacterium Delta 3]
MDKEEFNKALNKIIANAWTDEQFRMTLLADTTAIFKENGIDLPEGLEVKAVEDTEKIVHFILPLHQSKMNCLMKISRLMRLSRRSYLKTLQRF